MIKMQRSIHRHLLSLCTLVYYAKIGSAVPNPEITQPPNLKLVQRQQDLPSNFIGYTQVGGQWRLEVCGPGSTISLSSSWAACDPTTQHPPAPFATTCEGGSVLIAPNAEYSCAPNVCYTINIYQSFGDSAPHTAYACDSFSRDVTYYVQTPETDAFVTTLTRTAVTTRTILTTRTAVTYTAGSPTDGGSDVNNDLSHSSTGLSHGAIAGLVIGSIAAVGIIGLLVWIAVILCRRDRALPSPPEPILDHPPPR
ncbi:hypothetical protein TWF694_008996 [Orbilia ellipsospora]|uniref:Uncharacterized protein n=1 Tax=Orbilia ellipsospora TaxID=2528407 RepID=A0AAV9XEZ9_9PEZI